MSWYKPWEALDEMTDQLEEWANSLPKKKKKKKKIPNYYELRPCGSCYMLEYSPSSRAECKVCRIKITKNELRVGKEVQMQFTGGEFDEGYQRVAPIWFHSACFWGPTYRAHNQDPNRDSLKSYPGLNLISVKDQEQMHLNITGQSMSDEMVENAVIAETIRQEEVKKNGVFIDSDPYVIAESLVEKWLFNIPKADEVKHLVKVSGLTTEKGKNKKQDLLKLLHKQKFDKIPEVLTRSLMKYLTAADLKEILGPLKLKVSGNKGEQVSRLVTYITEHQPAPENAAIDIPAAAPANMSTETNEDKENELDDSVVDVESRKRTPPNESKETTPGLVSPLKKLKVRPSGETLIMGHVTLFCTKYLRVHDLKSILDQLKVGRKGVNKKSDLIELVTSQEVSLIKELCADSLLECASPEDLLVLCQEVGVEEGESVEITTELILAAM